MPKSKGKYYAVKVGRGGPQIYNTWEECYNKVQRYPGNRYKSFHTLEEAQEWIETPGRSIRSPRIGIEPSTGLLTSILPSNLDERPILAAPGPSGPSKPPSSQTEKPQETGESGVSLSLEQALVLNMVKSGGNVFFTGSAGTGKSVLLRQIICWARERSKTDVAVTASTGMAAVNIGGVTLHSWAGIGFGNGDPKGYVKSIAFGSGHWTKVRDRWVSVKTLIIDEISMIDSVLFDKLEYIARGVRKNESPFGGIQLVLSGDFFQLPPVELGSKNVHFAFQAQSWKQCIDSVTTLTRVFRQKEQSFVDLLNDMRFGKLSEQSKSRLTALSRQVKYTDSVEPTELFPTKREVQFANESRLAKLSGLAHTFRCTDHAGIDDKDQDITPQQAKAQLDRCILAPEAMTLKVGAQVMLIKNVEQGVLVNGSVGKITNFLTCQKAKEVHNIEIAVPPRDKEEDPVTKVVRISARLWTNPIKWPVVEFPGGRTRLIPPHEFTIENVNGSMQALRLQVPLILAWAISIHKSQGQTLQRVRVNLGRIFEKGQAYVALSRATSLQTLQVLNFDSSRVMVHETVLNWHEQNTERDRKALALAQEMSAEEAVADSTYVDSDWE